MRFFEEFKPTARVKGMVAGAAMLAGGSEVALAQEATTGSVFVEDGQITAWRKDSATATEVAQLRKEAEEVYGKEALKRDIDQAISDIRGYWQAQQEFRLLGLARLLVEGQDAERIKRLMGEVEKLPADQQSEFMPQLQKLQGDWEALLKDIDRNTAEVADRKEDILEDAKNLGQKFSHKTGEPLPWAPASDAIGSYEHFMADHGPASLFVAPPELVGLYYFVDGAGFLPEVPLVTGDGVRDWQRSGYFSSAEKSLGFNLGDIDDRANALRERYDDLEDLILGDEKLKTTP